MWSEAVGLVSKPGTMAKPKHSKSPGAKSILVVENNAGAWEMTVEDRRRGPSFHKWFDSVDSSLALVASRAVGVGRRRLLQINLWANAEALRDYYHAGLSPMRAMRELVKAKRQDDTVTAAAPSDYAVRKLAEVISDTDLDLRYGESPDVLAKYAVACMEARWVSVRRGS